jgi:hypothetical protein
MQVMGCADYVLPREDVSSLGTNPSVPCHPLEQVILRMSRRSVAKLLSKDEARRIAAEPWLHRNLIGPPR